jgi:pseudouridine-5'-phosphate glycosidase
MDVSRALFQDRMVVSHEIRQAVQEGEAVVALESAVVTHGLPYPPNVEVARAQEQIIRDEDVVPATVAVVHGEIRVGLSDSELHELGSGSSNSKVSVLDLPIAMVRGSSGGTTVAATIFLAAKLGIRVFSTGGIGGVHKENASDVSADLTWLSRTPMVVVCAGAKAILDLPNTMERLETLSVPVIGFRTDELPAFYSRGSGLPVHARADSPQEVAEYWSMHRLLEAGTALVVANPIPESSAIPRSEIEPMMVQASKEAQEQNIRGQALTPFLLGRVKELSNGASLRANEALLLSNARLAARIAVAIAIQETERRIQR